MSLNFKLPELFVELKLMLNSSFRFTIAKDIILVTLCCDTRLGGSTNPPLAPKSVSFTLEKLPTVVIGKYVKTAANGLCLP
jgi:hypothetical protein